MSKHVINANEFIGDLIEADIAIIGSGAGGGVSAEIFAKAGFKVLIIEEGPYLTARDFKMQEKEAYSMLYYEAAARKTLDKGINILQGRNVGGSTTVNWTSSFRTPDQTLNHWQKFHGLKKISPESMRPWFEKMEKRLNIKPWPMVNANNSVINKGAAKLGWQVKTIARNVKACANLGYCGMGCPLNAKQSMLVTTIPAAEKLGAKVLYQAQVEKLAIEGDKVTGCWVNAVDLGSKVVSSKRASPKKILVRAKHTILSAGAIGSPAILLRSKAPDPYQRIGKRTMLHPVVISAGRMPQKVNGFSGAPQSVYSDQFLWPENKAESEKLGFKIEAAPLHPALVSTVLAQFFGDEHFKMFKDFAYIQGSLALLRDGFSNTSQGGQVLLDDYQYPKLDYQFNDHLWDAARRALLAMAELQFAAAAEFVLPVHLNSRRYYSWQEAKKSIAELPMETLKAQVFSAHVMGGNAMGSDEKYSVVDDAGRFRWLEGLHIFDGSIFPTSIGANPQLSIYGLVAKLATELADKLSINSIELSKNMVRGA